MATKINPDFYGAENTFVDIQGGDSKHSVYNLATLFTNGIYTGGQFDTTAAPWGCGKSSFASDYTFFAGKGQNWTVLDLYNNKKNTPMFMYWASSPPMSGDVPDLAGDAWSVANYTRGLYKARMSPNVAYSSGAFKSTLSIDNNQDIAIGGGDVPFYPITYLDYQKIRAVITDVWYKPEGATNNQKTTMSAIKNGTVSVDTIVAFKVLIYHKDSPSNAYPLYIGVGGAELDMPELYRTCYYGDDVDKWVRTWRYVQTFGYWELSSSYGYQYNTTDNFNVTSYFDTPSADNKVNRNSATSAWGHIMPDTQTFDDVTYTWHTGLYVVDTNDPQNLSNKIANGDLYANGTVGSYAYMTLDDYSDNKNAAAFNAILHEVAYIGLPFTYSSAYVGENIGHSEIYLPVFDEHMITTGNFISGADSLELPNATWNDVFGADMPEYDPTYEPDEPIPDDDYGDTTNTGNLRIRIPSDLKVYLMDESTLHQMLYRLNNYYSDKTPDDWTIDFQGVNPSDYILGCYVTRLNLPPSSIGEAVKVGVIDLNLSAYTLNQVYDYWCTIDFGTRTIQPRYNDFRDYAPYTSVELYLPLAGTVDLDVNYCMGHNITVKYYYDVLTMSCVAAVYRDNMLYKCSDCKIGAEIPLLSSNMGSYQNQIEQLSVARQRNNIAIATSGAAAIAGTTAAIATGSPMAIIGAAGGFSKLADNIIESNNLDYQFDHIAPSVSVTGAADAQNNLCVGQLMPKLIIKRPVMLSGHNDTIYSKTVGNACCINDYIGSRTGLVVCSNINANDIVNTYGESPTADEINSIKQAFSNGVYV